MRPLFILLVVLLAVFLLLGSGDLSARWPGVSSGQLRAWLDSADPPLILDVRGRAAYRAGTLAGALDGGIEPGGFLPDGGGGRLVLLLPEAASEQLVEAWFARLSDAGHQVWILEGGIAGWVEAGGSVEMPQSTYTRPGSVPFLIPRGLCEGGSPSQVFD
ncbi:MAG: hypothetical protein OQL28_11550 [Sedimenticola sp.]|nr:hypothetical protein [Sedimenticola sp.]